MAKSEADAMAGRNGLKRLYVESPIFWEDDVGEKAFNFEILKKHFKMAHDLMYSYGPKSLSLLGLVISDQLHGYMNASNLN